MKKFIYTLVLALILCSAFNIQNSYAQWEPDVRLTNAAGNSYMSDNNAWCIAANGNVVHTVWFDTRDGHNQIYYKRSTNGGTTWGADTRLTNNAAYSDRPSIAVSGSQVHVVWSDLRDNNYEVYYKRSTDGGTTWGTDTRLTNSDGESALVSVAVSGTQVHIVWRDARDGNEEIYYKRSTDGGTTWEADKRLTNDPASCLNPSVAVYGSQVHVVWCDLRSGVSYDVYYKKSTDGGITWGADTSLIYNQSASYFPSVAVSGSQVNVVWQDYRDGNFEIYYKRSTDGGTTWDADTRLTNYAAFSQCASVAVSGSQINVVWKDNRDGNFEIYYKRSTDGGTTWEADTRLTNNSGISDYPSVAVSGSQVHVVWQDDRDGNNEIYYKRTLPPVPSIPTLVSPVNNSVAQPLGLSLVWNKTLYSTKYKVLLATDSLFTNVILNDSLLTDSVKSLTNLNTLTNYYWKVSAGNIAGWSSYSSPYKFKTIGSPTQVNLFSPANNAVNQPVDITFKWYKAIDQIMKSNKAVSNYWVEYSTDSSFLSGVVKDSTITDSLKSITGLNLGNKYYWRVKAKNVAGWGNFSSIWNFTTVPPAPAAPVLVSPLNNSINLQLNVLLDWSSVSFAASYRIQIANDSMFTSMVFDTSSVNRDSLRVRPGLLTLNTKYFWRVNAANVSGTGQWSSVWNFRTSSVGINITGNVIPDEFKLYTNYPNPFNPTTKIRFEIPKASVGQTFLFVTIKVFDIMGREIATLVNEVLAPGTYEATFDGTALSSGTYFYKLTSGSFSQTKKLTLLK